MSYARHLYNQRREYTGEHAGAEVQRLLFHWPTVMRLASDEWARSFAASVWKQSGRRGWHPSPKQLQIMQRLVREMFDQGDAEEIQVIDEE